MSVVCANFIVAGTLALIAHRISPMAWSFRPVILSISLTVAIVLAAVWVGRLYGIVGFASVAAIGLVSFLPLSAFLLFSALERGQVCALIVGWAKEAKR